jgi:hypothetical protein
MTPDGPPEDVGKPSRFHKEEVAGGRERHYYLRLLQVGGLLLKNHGVFWQKQYSLVKRRFSNALLSILSGEGFDKGRQG